MEFIIDIHLHDLYTIMETQQPLTLQVQIYRVQSSQHIKTQHNNYYANDITMYYKVNKIIYVIHNIFKCIIIIIIIM